jgi:hypothetical protein
VEQLVIPDYDGLREECVYAVHAHPYAGHYGINRDNALFVQLLIIQ